MNTEQYNIVISQEFLESAKVEVYVPYPDGGGRNFIATPSLQRAIRMNKRLKLSVRQIDVRIRGKRPFVLRNSWL